MMRSMQQVRTIDLVQGQMLVIEGGRGGSVHMLIGAAWLTHEGEPGDSVVQAGCDVALGGGRVVIEALGPARVLVAERAMPWRSAWRQVWRRLRRQATRWQLGPVAIEHYS